MSDDCYEDGDRVAISAMPIKASDCDKFYFDCQKEQFCTCANKVRAVAGTAMQYYDGCEEKRQWLLLYSSNGCCFTAVMVNTLQQN